MLCSDRWLVHQGQYTAPDRDEQQHLNNRTRKYNSDKRSFLLDADTQFSQDLTHFFFPCPELSGFNKEAEGSLGTCLKMMSIFLLIHPSLWRTSCHWWRRKYFSSYRFDEVMILKSVEYFRVGWPFLDGCYPIYLSITF